jgi:hypothetical protein
LWGELNGVELSGQYRFAQVVEQLSQAGEQGIAPITFGQRLTRRVAQQAVDGGQAQGWAGGSGRHQALRQRWTA